VPRVLAAGRPPQDRGAPQRQPPAAAAQAQSVPQLHAGLTISAVDDAAVALQPQAHAAPGQSRQVHEGVAGTFMAISWFEPDPADPWNEFCSAAPCPT